MGLARKHSNAHQLPITQWWLIDALVRGELRWVQGRGLVGDVSPEAGHVPAAYVHNVVEYHHAARFAERPQIAHDLAKPVATVDKAEIQHRSRPPRGPLAVIGFAKAEKLPRLVASVPPVPHLRDALPREELADARRRGAMSNVAWV